MASNPGISVVIPGAQKAGTTSLLDALGRHSLITRHSTSEFPALLDPCADLEAATARDYPPAPQGGLRLAKSVAVMHQPEALARLHDHNPEIRLIFMLRDPVSRMYSAYWFARRTGDEPRDSFADAVAGEGNRHDVPEERRFRVEYRRRSEYLEPLRTATQLFGKDHVRVVLLEDFGAERTRWLNELQAWLNLPPENLETSRAVHNAAAAGRSHRVARLIRSNGSAAQIGRRVMPRSVRQRARSALIALNEKPLEVPPMEVSLRQELVASFREHNAHLVNEFGLDLSRWSQS